MVSTEFSLSIGEMRTRCQEPAAPITARIVFSHDRIYPPAFAYGILPFWMMRREEACRSRGSAGAKVCRDDGSRKYLRSGALFRKRRKTKASSRFWGANPLCARRRIIGLRLRTTSTTTYWCWRRNEEGYRNLIRLTSEASLNGFYRKPRVSKKYLAENVRSADWILRLPERGALRSAGGEQL